MSYMITNQCIGCDRCHIVCPTNAIQYNTDRTWIDSTACNNCVGFYQVPQCAAICPTNQGCIPGITDYWEHWFKLYSRVLAKLTQPTQTAYWDWWFDAYSQQVSGVMQTCKS